MCSCSDVEDREHPRVDCPRGGAADGTEYNDDYTFHYTWSLAKELLVAEAYENTGMGYSVYSHLFGSKVDTYHQLSIDSSATFGRDLSHSYNSSNTTMTPMSRLQNPSRTS